MTVAPEFAKNQMEAKNLLFGDARYQDVPSREKVLAGIAFTAAPESVAWTDLWIMQVRFSNDDALGTTYVPLRVPSATCRAGLQGQDPARRVSVRPAKKKMREG